MNLVARQNICIFYYFIVGFEWILMLVMQREALASLPLFFFLLL